MYYKVSENVIIVKLNSEKDKKKIMVRKKRLEGRNVFIKNDLSWKKKNAGKNSKMG